MAVTMVTALRPTTLFFMLIGVAAVQFGDKLVSGGCRSDSDCAAYPNTVCLKSYGSCLADPNSAGFCVCSPTHPNPVYPAYAFSQPPTSCTNDTFSAAGGNCTSHASECGCADTYLRFDCHWNGYCKCGSMFGIPTANGLDCVRNTTAAALHETCQNGVDCATKGARCDWNQAAMKMMCGCDGIFIESNGTCKIPELGDPCQSDHQCSKGFVSVSCVNNTCGCKAGETHIAKAFRFRTDYIDGIRHSHFPYAYDYLDTCTNTSLLSTMFAAPENGTCSLNSTHVVGCQPSLVCETCGFVPGSMDDLEGICVRSATGLQAPRYQQTCAATPMPQLAPSTTIPPPPITVTGTTGASMTGTATTGAANTATTTSVAGTTGAQASGAATTGTSNAAASTTTVTGTTVTSIPGTGTVTTVTLSQGSTASVATATTGTPTIVAGATGSPTVAGTTGSPTVAGTTGSSTVAGSTGTGNTIAATTTAAAPLATGTTGTGNTVTPTTTPSGSLSTGTTGTSATMPIATGTGTTVIATTGPSSSLMVTGGTPATGSTVPGTVSSGSSAAATATTGSATTGTTVNLLGNAGGPPPMSSQAGTAIASAVALLSAWRITMTGYR